MNNLLENMNENLYPRFADAMLHGTSNAISSLTNRQAQEKIDRFMEEYAPAYTHLEFAHLFLQYCDSKGVRVVVSRIPHWFRYWVKLATEQRDTKDNT